MCAFRQAGAGGRADYVDGDSYPSVVAVHASFGNMLGGFVVMELVKAVVPFLVPIPLSFILTFSTDYYRHMYLCS